MLLLYRLGRRECRIVTPLSLRGLSNSIVPASPKRKLKQELTPKQKQQHTLQLQKQKPPPSSLKQKSPFSSLKQKTQLQQQKQVPQDQEEKKKSHQKPLWQLPFLNGGQSVTSKDDVFLPPGSSSLAGLRRLACSNIFVGTTSNAVNISHAEFVKSSVDVQECPKNELPEFAFVGRSNVGKSTLINCLVHKKLAKTSKTPGKTQVINHFSIDKSWYLVDLPGYGFARAPTDVRVNWDQFTRDYFLKRERLVCVLLLVDASVPPKKSDLEYANWLASNKVPLTVVFTKCDKRRSRSKSTAQNNAHEFLAWLKDDMFKVPPWVMTSCITSQGTSELLMHLAALRDYWIKRTLAPRSPAEAQLGLKQLSAL